MNKSSVLSRIPYGILLFSTLCWSAPDRITSPIDARRVFTLESSRHPALAEATDLGRTDDTLPIGYATIFLRPSEDIEAFLRDLQDRASPNYHRWLTPQQFGTRFGASASDLNAVAVWLRQGGLRVHDIAQGGLWITFSGTAGQIGRAFRTEIHRYSFNGETHFGNTTDIQLPEAFRPLIAGVGGLDDFRLTAYHHMLPDDLQPRLDATNGSHFLAPDDIATIYGITPVLTQGFFPPTLVVLGQTSLPATALSDIDHYVGLFNLPPINVIPMGFGPDPGISAGDVIESELDLEIAGAVARNARLLYVYSQNVIVSAQYAIDQNLGPVLSMSYGSCELSNPTAASVRGLAQQANAQGITWVVSSGDSGAAACDRSSPTPQASKGNSVSFPASLPEVTAVGGTTFDDSAGIYWQSNRSNLSSAISYIPETSWNDSVRVNGLDATGGGPSALFTKPAWQNAAGVPADGARDVPDVAFAASALHDGYAIYYGGGLRGIGGTSAGAPLFAGIVALLNAAEKTSGLGNINPDLYRLAGSDAFHDITTGSNIVPCAQSSPGCTDGLLGYAAGAGYDLATGLGSLDASHLLAAWNSALPSRTGVVVAARFTYDEPAALNAVVLGAGPAPTGTVTFIGRGPDPTKISGHVLGAAPLNPGSGSSTASLTIDGSIIAGDTEVFAYYGGDASYFGSSNSTGVPIQQAPGDAGIVPLVRPTPVYQAGSIWPYTLTVRRAANDAEITAFTIDGVDNLNALRPCSTCPVTLRNQDISVNLAGAGLKAPLNRTFHFEGVSNGVRWQRDLVVPFAAGQPPLLTPGIGISLSPAQMQQNPSASAACQWSQTVTVQEMSGYEVNLQSLAAGDITFTDSLASIFGTTRLAPHGMLSGTICYSNIAAPAQKAYLLAGTAENGAKVQATGTAVFLTASPGPAHFTTSASGLHLSVADPAQSATTSLTLQFDSGAPSWTASMAFSGQKWLSIASPAAGAGSAVVNLQTATGLTAGVYFAMLSIDAQDAVPQSIRIPVSLTVGASQSISIAGIGNAASGAQTFAPGELVAVYGSNLAPGGGAAAIQPLPFTMQGVSATVNGVSAPLWYVSPGQMNLQIPYETSAGPAVLGINNNGQVAAFPFTVSQAAPGIFAFNGFVVPTASVAAGQAVAMYVTGSGDLTPTLATGASPFSGTTQYPAPRLPITVTVGGEPAQVVFAGATPGLIGVLQVNFVVPADAPAGVQPVVVSVGGFPSTPVNLTVNAPVFASQ